MSEGCLCELVADKAASKGLRAQPAVLAVSLHQQHSLQTQHRQTTSVMNTAEGSVASHELLNPQLAC